jgi:DNA-binding IclR family transcriptional regulator
MPLCCTQHFLLANSPGNWTQMKKAAVVKDERDEIDGDSANGGRYRAPALEKGLKILELLAGEAQPMLLSAICQRLGRSANELFRMVQVLQYQGYIDQAAGGGYRLTDKLFSLGMEQPRTRNLLETALPVMRQLAVTIGQSCHLAVHSKGQIVVIARMESDEQIGFTVRVGYRQLLLKTASGAVLYAHQNADTRKRWAAMWEPQPGSQELAAFQKRCDSIRGRGHEIAVSNFVAGVTDISAPVMRGEQPAAALTVPFVHSNPLRLAMEETVGHIEAAAREISEQLLHGDSRV